jgi:hypothetical protein
VAAPGNGSDNEQLDDEDRTPTVTSIGDPRNREMLAILSNYVLEAKEHFRRLEDLYADLRQLPYMAHNIWAVKVLEIFEKHQDASAGNLKDLRDYVRKGS